MPANVNLGYSFTIVWMFKVSNVMFIADAELHNRRTAKKKTVFIGTRPTVHIYMHLPAGKFNGRKQAPAQETNPFLIVHNEPNGIPSRPSWWRYDT